MNAALNWPARKTWMFAWQFGFGLGLAWAMPNLLLAQKIAEGGSPLYSFTVQESLAGLKTTGKEKAANEGQVCPHCGKIHPPAQTVPHTNAAAGTVPTLRSVGTIAGKYYYCDQCKVYHQIQAVPTVPKVPIPGVISPLPLNTNNSSNGRAGVGE